ncbi:hypothetical protein chiPu_0019519 [Chiloscyllium punctatum]|uniref:Uncharacterized protein n=1 Tax=Chiloscyllium punctatum TaxID=137246 RepID=A0A401RSE0_CHIPU|nr:hypothetical protein [Chiloscyllium punctatum]
MATVNLSLFRGQRPRSLNPDLQNFIRGLRPTRGTCEVSPLLSPNHDPNTGFLSPLSAADRSNRTKLLHLSHRPD